MRLKLIPNKLLNLPAVLILIEYNRFIEINNNNKQ